VSTIIQAFRTAFEVVMRGVWTLVLLMLLAARLPSLVEPAGADQSLYAYVGQRVNAGDVAYRDAWDQKPPVIHFIYAGLWRVWPHDEVVAAADLATAGVVAWLLVVLGHRTFGSSAGFLSAGLFLVLGNPAIQRLSGVRVRSQCETFVALVVTAAMVILAARTRRSAHIVLAGVCLGLAFWLKYNAGIYALPALALATARNGNVARPAAFLAIGFGAVSVAFLSYFAAHGALTDLGLATVSYNLHYSGETYAGFRGALDYLTFPIDRAKLDLLWYLGGIGALVLLVTERRNLYAWVALGWIVAACVSVAVNGARNLPQYFVQANPALAFAAGAGWVLLVRRGTPGLVRAGLIVLLAAGLWRVGDEQVPIRLGGLPEAIRNTWFDLNYARGRVDRTSYLARFQEQADTKYVPLAAEQLLARVRAETSAQDRILVFGLAANVYVNAPRQSASRFFWSRPVVVEFGRGRPGYGSAGLLQDLRRTSPAMVVLQKHWGDPGPRDFFMNNRPLRGWLEAGYVLEDDAPEFAIWRRRS
jgi:hypothetical protein